LSNPVKGDEAKKRSNPPRGADRQKRRGLIRTTPLSAAKKRKKTKAH